MGVKDSQESGAATDALPVCLGSRIGMGAHGYPGGITSPNIPDTRAAWGNLVSPCEPWWDLGNMGSTEYDSWAVHISNVFVLCAFLIATNKTVNPYFLPNPSSAFASASGLPTSSASIAICATQGEQDHCTYSDDK